MECSTTARPKERNGTTGHLTVRVAEPLTLPAVAVMVTAPAPTAKADPWLLASLLICAMVVFDEVHVTAASCSVLPPMNVPVAKNRCVAPAVSVYVPGVTTMDTRLAGDGVPSSYNSALAEASVAQNDPRPPAISTT